VVVGDDDFDAARTRRLDTVDAGDAVVDGDDDVRRGRARRQLDDLRRQAIAVFEAVRHDVVDAGAHRAQAAQGGGAGGSAVAVVVGDDGHLLAALNSVGQVDGSGVDLQQCGGRHQGLQFAGQLARIRQAARGIHAGQYGVDSALG
jgi:hypothetical protein